MQPCWQQDTVVLGWGRRQQQSPICNYEADDATIETIEKDGRVAFRYCDASGVVGGAANPNGSRNDIAGIYSERFNVLGLMPHPENLIDPLVGGVDGKGMFASLAAAAG